MAITLTNITGLTSSSGVSTPLAWSCCFWFRPNTDIVIPDYVTAFAKINAGYTKWTGIFTNPDGTQSYHVDVDTTQSTGQVLTAGKWYPIWFRSSGSIHNLWISGIDIGFANVSVTTDNYITLLLGNDGFSKSNGTFAYFRDWNQNLQPSDFFKESNSRVAVFTGNLVRDTPLINNLLDISGNGNDWSTTGADFTFVADDPIPVGCTASDAINIASLPFNTTYTVPASDVIFNYFDQWYKYTAVSPEVYIGGWFFGDLSNYKPRTKVYSDAGITEWPPNNPFSPTNLRFQMPVTAGATYWFKAEHSTVPNTLYTQSLTVDFLTAPREVAPVGALAINDDLQDYGMCLLSSVDGDDNHVYSFISPFIPTNSEGGGAITTSGLYLILNDITGKYEIYDNTMTLVVTTNVVGTTNQTSRARTAPNNLSWYTITPSISPILLSKIGTDGTLLNQWVIPGGNGGGGVAPNNDESIIYLGVGGANQPIRKFDPTGAGSIIGDLVGGAGAGLLLGGIMVLQNGNIVAGYATSVGLARFICYNTAGVTQWTCGPFGATTKLGDFSEDVTDPATYFRARIHHEAFEGSTTLLKIRISDGVVIDRTDYVEYENGVYSAVVTATPIAKFGPSLCCPFALIRASISPIVPISGGIYKIVPGKRQDTLWVNFDPVETEDVKIPDPFAITALLGE